MKVLVYKRTLYGPVSEVESYALMMYVPEKKVILFAEKQNEDGPTVRSMTRYDRLLMEAQELFEGKLPIEASMGLSFDDVEKMEVNDNKIDNLIASIDQMNMLKINIETEMKGLIG